MFEINIIRFVENFKPVQIAEDGNILKQFI